MPRTGHEPRHDLPRWWRSPRVAGRLDLLGFFPGFLVFGFIYSALAPTEGSTSAIAQRQLQIEASGVYELVLLALVSWWVVARFLARTRGDKTSSSRRVTDADSSAVSANTVRWESAVAFAARHRILGPLLLGIGSAAGVVIPFAVAGLARNDGIGALAAMALIGVFIGSSVPGYILGKGGSGLPGLLLAAAGLLTTVIGAVIVSFTLGPRQGIDPSLALDGLVFAGPFLAAFLVTPLALGWGRGRSKA